MVVPPSAAITGAVPYLNWSGFHVGLNAGYAWGNSSVSYNPNDAVAFLGTCGAGGTPKGQCIPSTDFHRDGPLAGAQAGFDWQVNSHWLIGAEADFQWSDFKGIGASPFRLGNVGATQMLANQTVKWFGTVRARAGAVLISPLVLYGTGGLAYGQVSETLSLAAPATGGLSSGGFSYSCIAGSASCFAGSSTATLWGWSAGAGAEYALTTNLILRTELLYVHLEAPRATAAAQGVIGATTPASFAASFPPVYFAVVRGGLNLRF